MIRYMYSKGLCSNFETVFDEYRRSYIFMELLLDHYTGAIGAQYINKNIELQLKGNSETNLMVFQCHKEVHS